MKFKIDSKYFDKYNMIHIFNNLNNLSSTSNETIFNVSDDFVRDFQIELLSGHQTNYTTYLIRLLLKADRYNLNKLIQIYPEECLFLWCYQNISDFYKQLT